MDWISFFDDNFIPYGAGSGTKRGEISTKCPMCGDDDPGTHMGISLTASLWGCWRNPQHRGKNPVALVQAYLGCSWHQAKQAVDVYTTHDPDALDCLAGVPGDWFASMGDAPSATAAPLKLPPWRPIGQHGTTAPFWAYLARRGFGDVQSLCDLYGLKCCLTGDYKHRVIVPFTQAGELIGFTGRAIGNVIDAPRYLSSGGAVKTTVFNEDGLADGGKTLIVVEGPFDALKVDFYGRKFGVRATCPFGVSLKLEQAAIIAELSKGFDQTVILFDHDAVEPAFMATDWIPGSVIGQLPEGVKDPGELSEKEIVKLIQEL